MIYETNHDTFSSLMILPHIMLLMKSLTTQFMTVKVIKPNGGCNVKKSIFPLYFYD